MDLTEWDQRWQKQRRRRAVEADLADYRGRAAEIERMSERLHRLTGSGAPSAAGRPRARREYSSPSHFAQLFRKENGLSPSDYRWQR